MHYIQRVTIVNVKNVVHDNERLLTFVQNHIQYQTGQSRCQLVTKMRFHGCSEALG